MVSSISSGGTGGIANLADSIFSKLDTKKQGYIDKSDLQSALSATDSGKRDGGAGVDDAFKALDGDGDGKVTKSELTDAMTKLADQLSAQFDAGRAGKGAQAGGPPPGGMAPPGGPHGPRGDGDGDGGASSAKSSTSSTATTYDPAADSNGDGTVSSDEAAAYKKAQASATDDTQQRDPMRALAHALHQLKAYTEQSGSSSSSSSSETVSVTA